MKQLCDLHTHSVFSDGTDTPKELIDQAISNDLAAIALCDHNTVDGLPYFLDAAVGKNIRAVCGAEFSVDYNGIELHLLGLQISPCHFAEISQKMNEVNLRKEESNRNLIRSLSLAGYSLDFDTIRKQTPNGKFNRAHIAVALTKQGYTTSINQAFETLLSPKAGYYQAPRRLTIWEMLDFLRSMDVIPVLAHPFLNLTVSQLREFLPQAKQCGLIGMETYYSLYDQQMTDTALLLAREFQILPSGGSDYHGTTKPDITLGFGKGNLEIPLCYLDALIEANEKSNR